MFHPSSSVPSEDNIASWLNRIAEYALVITFGLSPIIFIPTLYVPLGYSKVFLILIGLAVAIIFKSLGSLRSGVLTLRFPLISLAISAIALVALASALLSGDIHDGLVGNAFGIQTVAFISILALIVWSGLILRESKKAIVHFYMLFVFSGIVLGVFHILRFLLGSEAVIFGGFTSSTSTPLGSWNDLALFYGLLLLIALVAIEQLPLTKIAKMILAIITVISLTLLSVVNFVFVWVVLGVVSLVVLMYSLTRHRFEGGQLGLGVSNHKGSVTSVVLSIVVFLFSAMFVVSGSTLGLFVSELTNVNYIEVRPSANATFDIARAVLNEDPVLGVGPNKFIDAWRLHKNPAINQTIFWNTNFETGNGYITTALVTNGVLGLAAWLAFFLLLLYVGIQLLFKSSNHDRLWRFVAVSSWVASVYLWGMFIIYTPGVEILMLAAFFTGLFVAARCALLPGWNLTLSALSNRSFGFVLVAVSMFTIFSSIGALYYTSQHYLSLYSFNKAIGEVESGQPINVVLAKIAESYKLSQNDTYARQIASYSLAQLNSLLTVETTSETVELFRNAAGQGLNAARVATENDISEPLNWQILGQIYAVMAFAGVEDANERAVEAYKRAVELDPKNPLLRLLLAQLASLRQDFGAARVYAEESIALKPNYVTAIQFLTELDINDGNIGAAIEKATAIASLEPNNPARRYQLGILYASIGNTEMAVTAFESAIALDHNFSNARYYLALGYSELGRPAEAKVQLEAVLELNPGNELVQALINQLDTTGTINLEPEAQAEQPQENEEGDIEVSESGQVTTTEAPDTPLVSTVNAVPDESGESSGNGSSQGSVEQVEQSDNIDSASETNTQ